VREMLAARSDRDLAAVAPARRSRARKSAPWRRLAAFALERPGTLMGAVVIAGAATAIVVNALSFQTSRHPAPIFIRANGSRASAESAPRPPTPLPPARPAAQAPPPPTAPARPAGRDAIGDLIRSAEPPGAPGGAGHLADARLVLLTQRSLIKLGYGPLKVDGVLGQGTRQAIERFERDLRLPPTGDLTPRTIKELSAQAGMAIE
jgi:hypothetical protein